MLNQLANYVYSTLVCQISIVRLNPPIHELSNFHIVQLHVHEMPIPMYLHIRQLQPLRCAPGLFQEPHHAVIVRRMHARLGRDLQELHRVYGGELSCRLGLQKARPSLEGIGTNLDDSELGRGIRHGRSVGHVCAGDTPRAPGIGFVEARTVAPERLRGGLQVDAGDDEGSAVVGEKDGIGGAG